MPTSRTPFNWGLHSSLLKVPRGSREIPLWIKIAFTSWILTWTPTYFIYFGVENFLWICDFANWVGLAGLWANSSLLLSSQLLAVLVIGVFWLLDVIVALLTGTHLIGGTEYMFDGSIPLPVRFLSIFHIVLPSLLLWLVFRIGYDRRAIFLQAAIFSVLLPISFLATSPGLAINWVFGPFGSQQTLIPPPGYLLLCMLLYPVILCLPVHMLFVHSSREKKIRL